LVATCTDIEEILMNNSSSIIVGIDASRNRSGGAKVYLLWILTEGEPFKYGVKEIHVWAFQSLLDQLPDYPWLIKHNPDTLEPQRQCNAGSRPNSKKQEVLRMGTHMEYGKQGVGSVPKPRNFNLLKKTIYH
jgi:hypothetical protein